MSAGDDDLLRSVTREVLAELLPGLLEDALTTPNGNGIGAQPIVVGEDAVPQVPAPPVARVHRPTGWHAPASEPAPSPPGVTVEHVELRSDVDLDAFVAALARRLQSDHDREAILSGRVRFRLAGQPSESSAATIRVESGAVTERAVKEAAKTGARLVLSPRAVLTPLARDRARSLGVEIEKEA